MKRSNCACAHVHVCVHQHTCDCASQISRTHACDSASANSTCTNACRVSNSNSMNLSAPMNSSDRLSMNLSDRLSIVKFKLNEFKRVMRGLKSMRARELQCGGGARMRLQENSCVGLRSMRAQELQCVGGACMRFART
jgi:hypothetical protein